MDKGSDMSRLLSFFAIFILLVISCIANAEIYKDFRPNITLKEIKEKYPNGNYENVNAAWVTEKDAFIKLTGTGLAGTILLAFSNGDSISKRIISNAKAKIETNPDGDNKILESTIDIQNKLISLPLDEKLTLNWLRWLPAEILPFDRLVNRYGNPEKCGYNDESFQPFCDWISRAIRANLSDDKKQVLSIEFSFTEDDLIKSWGLGDTTPRIEEKPIQKPIKKKKIKM